jgi:altronate dehydratase
MSAVELFGFARPDGRFGVRNHVLVLPSVVCSSHSALEIAGDGDGRAIAITHQHGCLHVGDDLVHTERELVGTAVNPNVAGVVVVSLGCETINGARLAREIAARGQRVELVGIQASGGTRHAIAEGRAAVQRLAAAAEPTPIEPAALVVGLDAAADPLAEPLRAALTARGVTVAAAADGPRGAEAHVALAAEGAQLIVSLPVPDEAPIGFAICPVVAVGRETELHLALADDFDVTAGPDESAQQLAERVAEAVLAHAAGAPTASERRGARDFVLHRLAVTM